MIGVVSIGMGNIPSILSMFDRIDVEVTLVERLDQLDDVSTLILPGVGSFDAGATLLDQGGWLTSLREFARSKSIVGICLGMQLLLESSEEGELPGLGLIPGSSTHLANLGEKVVPNVGWRTVSLSDSAPQSLRAILGSNRFYFSHSYAAVPEAREAELGYVNGNPRVLASIQAGNVLGFQFHPERSQRGGLELFRWLSKRDLNEVR